MKQTPTEVIKILIQSDWYKIFTKYVTIKYSLVQNLGDFMGIGLRIFLVDDDDSIKRFPLTRFEKLIWRDPKVKLTQYAGKRVRFIEVALELKQRKPVQIIRFQPFVLSFDSEGLIDEAEKEKERRLIAEVISAPIRKREPGNVIDAHHRFAKKHVEHRYRWTPTVEIEKAVLDAIFGNDNNK